MPEATLTISPPVIENGFERHSLPSGIDVFYRDSDHSYYSEINVDSKGHGTGVREARLTGVSTVVGPYDWQPDGLMKWASHLTCEGVAVLAAEALSYDEADEMRCALHWLASGEQVATELERSRLRWQDNRDNAAARGTNVHLHSLHALAQGQPVPSYDSMTEEEKGYAAGVAAFFLDHQVDTICSEQVVCDPNLRIAGRLDLLCMLDGEPAVIDAKTSGYIPNKHHVQLAGYAHCAAVSGLTETASQYVLQVGPDGTYALIPSQGTVDSFLLAVAVYRDAARIKRDSNRARKATA